MNLEIKQLKLNGTTFVPQTVAEAVLMKQGSLVITLDQVINKKVDNVTSTEELTVTRNGNDIDITHTNKIGAIESPQPMLVLYDSTGHITNVKPFGKFIITANNLVVIESNGTEDLLLNFDDNFEKDNNNNITLRWNNYGIT